MCWVARFAVPPKLLSFETRQEQPTPLPTTLTKSVQTLVVPLVHSRMTFARFLQVT